MSPADLEDGLQAHGCIQSGHSTETGRFWQDPNDKYFMVPHPVDGEYPDWMLEDLIYEHNLRRGVN